MQRTSRMVTPREALDIILAHVPRVPTEAVHLRQAVGRVLAEPIIAPEDHPPFPAATMDGYAVLHDDTSPWREVIGEQYAGHVTDVVVTPGTAVRITTGAPLPAGADAVVPVEDVETVDDHVVLRRDTVRPGENVRPVGVDIRRGELVVPAGTVLGPAEIGLLASLGLARVTVARRPRVSVLSTGDELVEPESSLGPGQIRDSNRFMLVAASERAGAEVIWAGRGPDDVDRLTELLRERIADSDVVISSGGVSVGERDLISAALHRLGTVHIERLFMKPGKPFHFVTAGSTLLFGLPGNPVSALVGFELFIATALRAMTGQQPIEPESVTVVLEHDIEPGDRIEYQRAVVWCDAEGTLRARNTGPQSSARLLSAVGANAYLIVPPRAEPYRAGERLLAVLRGPIRGQRT
ncbi:MAG: molybdopterin molybdotransferase MoeA [Thermomicrobium sp.]|nr:molybdopterin molybdotransferase MoeA [Thermomicrobium sp.]